MMMISLHKTFFPCLVAVIVGILVFVSTISTSISAFTTSVDNLEITHDWKSASVIEVTMTADIVSNNYMAMAVRTESGSGMAGAKGIACRQPNSGATTTTCFLLRTFGSSITSRTDATFSLISASTTATKATVTVQMDPVAIGLSTGTAYDVNYAAGAWGSTQPNQHASNKRGTQSSVNFVQTGATPSPPGATTTSTTATTTTSSPLVGQPPAGAGNVETFAATVLLVSIIFAAVVGGMGF